MLPINCFSLSRLPEIHFGDGQLKVLPGLINQARAKNVLLVTGARSFLASPYWKPLVDELQRQHIQWRHCVIDGEPSPQLVDTRVAEFRSKAIDLVVAIGGGSVLDGGKAIAGLLPSGNSVLDHLEGIGRGIPYNGPALPFIAVPTTAGTGSEATKNAVLSVQGKNGYKKSFRHDTLVPLHAIVDPLLLVGCPPHQMAANGMDALTQLLESYVSSRATVICDALAISGMEAIRDGLFHTIPGNDQFGAAGRSRMAYAALLSGITLAQVGLGSVHGVAAPLGALFPVPHGVACGTLLAVATATNIAAMRQREPSNPALKKYANVGRLLAGEGQLTDPAAQDRLVELLSSWTQRLEIPRLAHYGVTPSDVTRICADSRGNSMKTNPILLTDAEISRTIQAAI